MRATFMLSCLVCNESDLGCGRRAIDVELHFAVFTLRFDRGGVVGATATGNDAGIKNSGLDTYPTFRLRRPDDHHIEFVTHHKARGREALLQRKLRSPEGRRRRGGGGGGRRGAPGGGGAGGAEQGV